MNHDPSRAEVLFLAAAEIANPRERAAFLEKECANDDALRRRVEALLISNDEAGDFLQPPAPNPEIEAELARLKPEEAGERIGNYKLLQQIGEGGFGVVWMAEQERPVRRRVALKIIKLGMDTKEVIARFEQERQALAMMDHPNIAKVFDAGATPFGRPFFVMELVRGIKITDYCDQASLPTADRLQLFIAVCQAVQHAHQKGIIHRDLKPSNILVTLHDGVPVPKVIDFGVAKAIQARLTEHTLFTQFEQMIGTPLYMSPEQAELSGLDIDTRSDIYSLGVLLYELLTGRTPVDGETLRRAGLDEIRRIIREQEPARPSMALQTMAAATRTVVAGHRHVEPFRLTGLLRGDLDWIVMKALEKDRSRRYETASGLGMDIQRHLANEPVLARSPSQLYRFQRMVKRNQLAFAAGGAVVVAMLLALVSLVFSNARIGKEKNQKELALQEKDAALVEAQGSAKAAREHLFGALLNRARAGRFSGQMGQRFDSLQALTEAARIRPDERLRDEAMVAMALPDVRPGPSWSSDRDMAIDESYRFSAKGDAQGIITVRSVPDGREIGRIESGRRTDALFFSKDGQFLAQFATDETWRVWRWADAHPVLSAALRGWWGIAFSPDSRYLAIAQDDHILRFALDTGQEVNRWKVQGRANSLAFNPDGRRLAVGYSQGDVTSIYDATDGKDIAQLPVGPRSHQAIAWHPDGIRLAIASSDPRIQIWNVDAKLKLSTLEGHVDNVTRLTFHPDGELLASDGWESVCRIWQPSSGRQLMQFSSLGPFSFSKDGRWLGGRGTGDKGSLLEVASSPEYRTIVSSLGAGQGEYYEGDVSPDGRLFALGMNDGVRVWDTSTWRELAFLPIGFNECVIFQPDGRELLTCGARGLLRWPIQTSLDAPNVVRLGPWTKIPLPFTPQRASRSRDGKTLAVVSDFGGDSGGGGLIVDLTTGAVKSPFLPHHRAAYVALSPDGQWMASSGWHSDRARLWDVAKGQMIQEWTPGGMTAVAFTPDSRTFIIGRHDEFSFWNVATFQSHRRLRSDGGDALRQVAFSPDGTLLAVALAPAVVHLQDAASGRTVARLEDPHGERVTWIGFNADGTQLLTATNYAKAVHVWDLRAIRARLKEMKLDWDWPEFRPIQSNELQTLAKNLIRSIEVIGAKEAETK